MSQSSTEAVSETLRLALQQSIARIITSEADWDRLHTISTEAAKRIDDEMEAYKSDYPSRLAAARQMILREYAGRSLDMPTPSWVLKAKELPSPEKLDHMADGRVRHDHGRRLRVIRQDEVDQLREMRRDLKIRAEVERETRAAQSPEHRRGDAREAFQTTQMRITQSRKR
ncbi:hypothetical protein [Thalassococcus sp. S3]|uniref:hypothetical protein n=1 Tax=Thalassococcus sp. S3 TaxID=2017482 RepID=UPI0010245B23|nr:hypothetical protein [Thalassococcus sp. S3]QBF32348.1 hypothetical protein CFI11_14155 [Thalassococcus sp. S3]